MHTPSSDSPGRYQTPLSWSRPTILIILKDRRFSARQRSARDTRAFQPRSNEAWTCKIPTNAQGPDGLRRLLPNGIQRQSRHERAGTLVRSSPGIVGACATTPGGHVSREVGPTRVTTRGINKQCVQSKQPRQKGGVFGLRAAPAGCPSRRYIGVKPAVSKKTSRKCAGMAPRNRSGCAGKS